MTTETKYTALEVTVICAFSAAFNYRDPQSEKDDNATALNVEDIVRKTGLAVETVKGVFGSLYKKGLLVDWDEPDMIGESFITEEGIDAHYSLKEKAAA